jgi:predicted nucleotidyltransferase
MSSRTGGVFGRGPFLPISISTAWETIARPEPHWKAQTGLDSIENIVYSKNMEAKAPFIDEIVSLIVSLVSPDQIVLFGSYARGDYTEKSDIDLLIIKKNLNNEREINNLLYKAFYRNDIDVPVDLISIDYDKYMELNDEIGYIYKTIKDQGKVLYGTL